VSAGGVRRSPTLAALPKLTAATAAPAPKEDEVQATQLVSSDHVFDDSPEPTTVPGKVGRAVTAAQARAPAVPEGNDEEEEAITNRTAVLPPPPPAPATQAPPRLTQQGLPPVVPSASPPMPPRASMSVPTLAPVDAPPPPPGGQRGSRGGDGLPRIVRDVPPPEMSQGIPRNALPPEMSQGLPRSAMPPDVSQGLSRNALPPEFSQGLPRNALPPEMSQGLPRNALGTGRRQEEFQDELDDDQERPTSTIPALAQKGVSKPVLFGGLALLVLMVVGALGFLFSRPSTGFILVELQGVPAEARGRVQVLLDTQPVPVAPGDSKVVKEVPAGQVMVMVSAEGYTTYTTTVEVAEGKGVTRVNAELASLERKASLIITTTPADAEVSVDGKVVRAQGKTGTFIKGVPVSGTEWVVEVSAPDHKSASKKVQVSGDEPVELSFNLEPLVPQVEVSVESKPSGATIFVDGKDVGMVTPATIVVPATAKALELKKKCYDVAAVAVPQTGGDASASLKKQRNCR
jgi:hypothetical protein